MCEYVLKYEKYPLVSGRHSLENIIDIVKNAQQLSPKKKKKHKNFVPTRISITHNINSRLLITLLIIQYVFFVE